MPVPHEQAVEIRMPRQIKARRRKIVTLVSERPLKTRIFRVTPLVCHLRSDGLQQAERTGNVPPARVTTVASFSQIAEIGNIRHAP